jgi:hypothetical protein
VERESPLDILSYVGLLGRDVNACSLVCIDTAGEIESIHRKLTPTYEERLGVAGRWPRAALEVLVNGGSCIAGPDGEWIFRPRRLWRNCWWRRSISGACWKRGTTSILPATTGGPM